MEVRKTLPAEMKELAKGVYAFLQPGGAWISNSGLVVGEKDAVVIDSLTNKYQVESLINKINEVTDKPIRLLVNTHFDPDHTFTNHYFPDAKAIATKAQRDETMKLHPYLQVALPKMFPSMSFEGAKMTPQDIIYKGTLTIFDGEREIQIIDMGSAHTESDAVIYLPEQKIVFCGDLVSADRRTAPPGITSIGKGSFHMIEVMNNLANFDADQFVPGHGDTIQTREQVVEQATSTIDFLLTMREEAHKCFNKGMTYKEAAGKIDYSKFTKWGSKETLYGMIYSNCYRAWKEFEGELPLGGNTDFEEIMSPKNPDPSKNIERIDMGYTRPWEDW
jgi:cyclase